MDPLSVSASIAGLITLAELIVSRGYEFLKGVKNAKAEITQLLVEITALFGVLQSLRLVALRFEGQHFNTTLQLEYLQSCQTLVDKIQEHLTKALPADSDGRWRAAGKSLRWPLNDKETKALIADVGRHKATLSLALNADGLTALLEVLNQQHALSSGQDGIQDSIDHLQEELANRQVRDEIVAAHKKRAKLLNDWTAIDPESHHAAATRLRHPGTGKWFLEGEEFRACVEGNLSTLWLYGIPGAGKTVLSSSIIESIKSGLAEKTREGLAYFYCDYKDIATQQASNIMRTLVKHAAIQNERSYEDLQGLLEKHKGYGTLDSTPSLSSLTDLALKMIGHYDCFYIVIDALDEVPDHLRHDVLSMLRDLTTRAINARVIFTSREETDIKEALSGLKPVRITANTTDLELYVASEIQMRSASGRLKIKHSEVKSKIIDKLIHGADGMFRWAACQLDYLCELPTDSARIRALDELPPSLFATYERILERIMARSEDVQKIVERTLRWTLYSSRKLGMSELIEAIAIEEGESSLNEYAKVDEEEILRWCSCLVRRSPADDGIELAHFTVEEFLRAIDPQKAPQLARFARLGKTSDLVLGRACLSYLNYDDFAKAKLEDWFWVDKNIFWNYAANEWHKHTAAYWHDKIVQSLTRRFFHRSKSQHFVLWNQYMWLSCNDTVHGVRTEDRQEVLGRWRQSQLQQVDSISPLHRAASLALRELTQWLISEGSDPNKNGLIGLPLECALESGVACEAILEMVHILVQSNANVNMMSERHEGNSPLALAVQEENPDLIKAILNAGAVVDMSCISMLDRKMSSKWSSGQALPDFLQCVSFADVPASIQPALIDLALNYRSTTEVALGILEEGSVRSSENAELLDLTLHDAAQKGQTNVVFRTIPLLINHIDSRYGERTALHRASMNGHYDILSVLLERGANANIQDSDGNTSAHLCIKENIDIKVLEVLMNHGARLSFVNKEHENLLHVAAQSSRPDVLEFLLTKDTTFEYRKMRTKDGKSLVLCALASPIKTLEMIELAGSATSTPEIIASNGDGETGLHLTTKEDDLDRMKFFLDKGNLNERTTDGSTALHFAATDGDPATTQLLLSRGADASILTGEGDTPLHLAAARFPHHLTAIMCAQGIELIINRRNKSGNAAIHNIITNNYFSSATANMLETLFGNPVTDGDLVDAEGVTPLTRLAMNMDTDTVSQSDMHDGIKILLQSNVDPDKPDKGGSTALHQLCRTRITQPVAASIKLLLEKNVNLQARNKEGSIPLEVLLLSLELDDRQVKELSEYERQILEIMFRAIPDDCFNSLSRGFTRPLVLALQYKATTLVGELAQRTSDVDLSYASDKSVFSPLEASCAYSCEYRIFEVLASRSTDLSKKNTVGNTLLHLACYYNKGDIITYLLARKIDLEVEDSTSSTALNVAIKYGRIGIMESLLEAGADPSHLDRYGYNLWHIAAVSPSTEILDKLFQKSKRFELEARNLLGYTPLMFAVARGCMGNAAKLFAQKAALNVQDDQANSVLHLACTMGNSKMLKFLLRAGPALDVNAINTKGQTPLLLAAAKGHHAAVIILLDAGGDPNVTDEYDQTLLHHLAMSGRTDILQVLKSRNIALDLDAKDIVGETPILCAVDARHSQMVGRLFDDGADIYVTNEDGFGLLHLAAYSGQASMIHMLFFSASLLKEENAGVPRRSFDVDIMHTADGDTPLMIAAQRGHLAVVTELLENHADVQKTNHAGQNVIHIAATQKKRAILKAIFEHCDTKRIRLDVNARDKKGRTALMLLEEEGADKPLVKRIADILKRRGAMVLEPPLVDVRAKKEEEWWEDCGGFCKIDGV